MMLFDCLCSSGINNGMNLQTLAFRVIIILTAVIVLVIVLPFVSGPTAIIMLFIVLIAAALSLGIINSKRKGVVP